MNKYVKGLQILRKEAEEEKNWKSARLDIEKLLLEAEDAQNVLDTFEQEKTRLEQENRALKLRRDELAQHVKEEEQAERTATNNRKTAERETSARKVQLEGENQAIVEKKEKVEKELAALRSRVGL